MKHYKVPQSHLSKYELILYVWKVRYMSYTVDLVAAIKDDYIFLIQKRPHNHGVIDSIVLGHVNSNGNISSTHSGFHLPVYPYITTHPPERPSTLKKVDYNLPHVEYGEHSWQIDIYYRDKLGNAVILYQRRRQDQSDVAVRDNKIVLQRGNNTKHLLNGLERIFKQKHRQSRYTSSSDSSYTVRTTSSYDRAEEREVVVEEAPEETEPQEIRIGYEGATVDLRDSLEAFREYVRARQDLRDNG